MEMKPDIENITLNEYLEYEAEKERRSWWNVRSKSSPTRYEGADFNSFHRDKRVTLDFLHYYKDALIDKYYVLMHVSGAWLILGCRETFQAGLVGCYTENDEVACECGCCLRK
ncbi:hypothetical protein Tco_0938001 [Tanacetum coccineum]|uniref:Uncharacterized protein n=1 Tax=Tanacetum coccineum TaxID=301880 RepID=A0ABQ5DFW0_9ASTR